MAYDQYLGERIERIMQERNADFYTKKMMGGLIFMVADKMCCGTHIDKKSGQSLLMARIGVEAYAKEINRDHTLPMDFTGRPMKGYIFIEPDGFDLDSDLEHWVDLCLFFNHHLLS